MSVPVQVRARTHACVWYAHPGAGGYSRRAIPARGPGIGLVIQLFNCSTLVIQLFNQLFNPGPGPGYRPVIQLREGRVGWGGGGRRGGGGGEGEERGGEGEGDKRTKITRIGVMIER